MNNVVTNSRDVNVYRLKQINTIVRRTMGLLMEQADGGVLKSISNKQDFEEYNKYLDRVIATAIRDKFKI